MAMLAMAATPGQAMPVAPAPSTPISGIVEAQFLGGPFFGRHGYYQPDRAKRFYFYEGYDPSLYPDETRLRHRHRVRHRFHRR